MGFKRYLDEEFQSFPSKHPKQLDCGSKLTFLAENKPSVEVCQRDDISGKPQSVFCKFQLGMDLESDSVDICSDFTDKELETSAPLSMVTSSAAEKDARYREMLFSPFYPEYFEFNFPRRTFAPCEDTYSSFSDSFPRKEVPIGPNHQAELPAWDPIVIKKQSLSLLDSFPRKEVPLGPNHQADLPVWEPDVIKKQSLSSDCILDNDNDMTRMGSCVIPMPCTKLSAHFCTLENEIIACNCMDNGSIRCIQQHVKEAREKLRETLGNEKFMQLGFCYMGEEVVHKWTEGEERAFHEVVYSNSVSSEKKYWEHLKTKFPSRTNMELVSYYFNIFILRRRAAQNRSNLLEIDSDDDEWQGNDKNPFYLGDDSDDDDEENNYDDREEDGQKDCGGRGHIFKLKTENAIREDLYAYDDLCTSFESHSYKYGSYVPVCEPFAIHGIRVKRENGKLGHTDRDMSIDGLGREYVMERADAATYPMGLIKSLDLLPTCNMIEEIFGPCSWNSNDKSIS